MIVPRMKILIKPLEEIEATLGNRTDWEGDRIEDESEVACRSGIDNIAGQWVEVRGMISPHSGRPIGHYNIDHPNYPVFSISPNWIERIVPMDAREVLPPLPEIAQPDTQSGPYVQGTLRPTLGIDPSASTTRRYYEDVTRHVDAQRSIASQSFTLPSGSYVASADYASGTISISPEGRSNE